jgi:diguanylate cyclase (GGDEF)-like protein
VQAAVEQQRRLQAALQELNDLRQRADQAEAALVTYRATGNAGLLRSVQPCAGLCLQAGALGRAVTASLVEPADILARVLHWAGQVDSALLAISQDSVQDNPGKRRADAQPIDDIAAEALTQGSRQLRSNLQGLESDLLNRLVLSESTRLHQSLLMLALLLGLATLALGGLVLMVRRAARLAADGLGAEEALRELSLRDPLTGLPNLRALGLRLEHLIERAERHGGGPAVLALDLDGFKHINELHGHPAGDAALVEVAQRLHAALRKSDLPARVGGDEFVVLLDDPDSPEVARAVGERLLLALRAPITLPGSQGAVELSLSVGLSHYPICGLNAADLLDAADAACLAAKQAGRNRLFEFRPAPATPSPPLHQPSESRVQRVT